MLNEAALSAHILMAAQKLMSYFLPAPSPTCLPTGGTCLQSETKNKRRHGGHADCRRTVGALFNLRNLSGA